MKNTRKQHSSSFFSRLVRLRKHKKQDTSCTEAYELIREIADPLRFTLRKSTASNQRRILRTYGFSYSYLQGKRRKKEENTEEEATE